MRVDPGWSDSVYQVALSCSRCGDKELHELRYAGRVLASSTCMTCGHVVRHDEGDLRKAYLRDLSQRVRSKPVRMVRRALHHPVRFLAGLPGSIAAKPARLAEEVKPLLRR